MATESKEDLLAAPGESGLAARLWRQKLELPGLIALGLIGAGIGLGVLGIGGFGPKPWTASVAFRVWALLVAGQTAIWTLAAAVLLSPVVRDPIGGTRREEQTPVIRAVMRPRDSPARVFGSDRCNLCTTRITSSTQAASSSSTD